jgi:hemoglobin/transferrin/lactoferrin receptor protein
MKKIGTVFLGIILSGFLYAQTDTAVLLKEVMVTATRNSQSSLLSPYSVSKLSLQGIDQFQSRTTPEALIGNAGVFVQKTNHGGGSPFVRSLTGNQNLLMIDGIRLNNATYRYGPNQYFNTIDLFSVGSIEVARGTGSVQYGSDAMGGVIQVFTKDPGFSKKSSWSGNIIGRILGNDAEYSGRAELAYSNAKTAFQIGYTERKFGDLPGGDTAGIQQPSGYKENALDAKFKWQLNSQWLLTAAYQQMQQNNVPLYHRVALENFAYYLFDPQIRSLSYLKIDGKTQNPILSKLSFTASSQVNSERRNYWRNGNANRFIEEDRVKTIGLTGDVFSLVNPNWTANTGVEFYSDKVNSSKQQIAITGGAITNQRGLYPNGATMQNFSLYSLHHLALGKFNIEGGVRYNALQIEVDTAIVKPASLVFNAALLYRVSKTQSVYASYSTGYRAPNIDDMGTLGLVDFRYEVPAYGLKPEKTFNTELGYKIQTKKVQLSLAIYYMHLTNIINRVQVPGQQISGYNVYIKENNQESYISGFEYDIQLKLAQNLIINTNGSYSFGQNTSRREPMRRIPPMNGRTFIEWKQSKQQFTLEFIYASKQSRLAQGDKDDNRIPTGGTPGFGVLNFHVGTSLYGVKMRTGITNIFNADYRMHGSGINGMGRNLYISAQFSF